MLSDRQAVILQLLTASIQSGQIDPFLLARMPDFVGQELEKLAVVADIFLEKTTSPLNAVSISTHLRENTLAMLEISNTLEKICQTFSEESNPNGSPHEVS